MLIRTLIVDDEPIARQILREDLELVPGIQIAGEAADGFEAVEAVRELSPDLVFLDLQMPGLGGFDVVRRLRRSGHVPMFVIVTAYDRYAIEAFEAGAVDYLLKPISPERLAQAVDRAAKMFAKAPASAEAPTELAQGNRGRRIVARSGSEYLLLHADEVLAFEADGDLVWIITAKKRYLATQTLQALQEKLGSGTFRRIHRSALVNIDHVRKMSPMSSQRWLVTLSNGQEFIVSKRLAHGVRKTLTA
jgi:DNA-binding LytR/AlgR family response regulator